MRTLDEIAISCGTDKASLNHNYTPYYEKVFEPMRDKPLTVVELGVYHGDSLRLWKEYFPNALIYGLDIEDMSRYNGDRVQTILCDQSNAEHLEAVVKNLPPIDIFIVDGSHQSAHDILTFKTVFPLLNQGAIYVNEDTLCSHFGQWNAGGSVLDFYKTMVDAVNMGGKVDEHWLCSNKKSEREKYDLNVFEREIESIQFSCGLVIIKKF